MTLPIPDNYIQPNYFVDSDHADIHPFIKKHTQEGQSKQEMIVQLYYAIRDGWRYNPYHVSAKKEAYRASELLNRSYKRGGHCIDKANLLAACARAMGIPARLHFANVRNHIGTEKFEKMLETNLMVFHGYVELWLDDRWVAATPAFNKELCEKLQVAPLEFDGTQDSIFQEFDRNGGQFMIYEHDYGTFAEIPFELMIGEWKKYYPRFTVEILGKLEN